MLFVYIGACIFKAVPIERHASCLGARVACSSSIARDDVECMRAAVAFTVKVK